MEKLDKLSVYGYMVFAMDGLYIDGNAMSDDQREMFMQHFKQALDYFTQEEAITYYIKNSNTNIKF